MSEPPATPPRRQVADLWSDGLGRAGIRSVQALAVGALIWAVLWVLLRIPLVVIPVVVAAILACAIAPLVRWLHGHGWPRALAVLASFVAILAVFGGIITGIVFLVRAQAHELAERFTAGLEQLHSFLNNGPARISDEQIAQARDSIQHFFTSGSVGAEALTGARAAGEIVTSLILMAVILFFFLKDGRQILEFLLWFMPPSHRERARLAADRSAIVLGGYVRGTVMVAAADAVIVGIGLQVLGVPLALPLAVFVFIGGFIPILGATLAGFLAVGIALISNGPVVALVALIVVLAANQIEHHLLQPLLMGRVLSIHGLAILLALASGTVLAGIIGALLAVPVTAVAWTVIKTWTGRGESPEGPPLSGSSWDASPAE
ncbi:AI-2E family transporter [Sinomonas sp. R1AF57]|uniref:AI-2E family transporter n=1 Tax=Sinomonas sp. R1AF57 TaxID=2020377 RepID=UPI000B5E5C6E|nr:AI-2E family transporter [Sinomonas sp. R1AF57]ASN53284.1 AI-2E family transporter [Sinomonas sp. R1AF57]